MYNDELYHFGVKGMRWGHRKKYVSKGQTKKSSDSDQSKNQKKRMPTKKKVAIGAAAVGTALAAYGGYKASKYLKSEAGKRSYKTGEKFIRDRFAEEMRKSYDETIAGKINLSEHYGKTLSSFRQMNRNEKILDKRTNLVKNSTKEAIGYLRHPERYSIDSDAEWLKRIKNK